MIADIYVIVKAFRYFSKCQFGVSFGREACGGEAVVNFEGGGRISEKIVWADALRDARLKQDLTISKLAQKVFVSPNEIQQYELGTKRPSLLMKLLLMRILKLPKNFWEFTPQEKYQLKILKGENR